MLNYLIRLMGSLNSDVESMLGEYLPFVYLGVICAVGIFSFFPLFYLIDTLAGIIKRLFKIKE